VLALAAQIPSNEIGSGYFQETHPEHVFAQCSHYCELVSQPEQMPRVLEIAIQTALSKRGVSVVAIPGDISLRDAVEQEPRLHFPPPTPAVCPSDQEIASAGKRFSTKSKKITILGGAGCAGAHAELIELAGKLKCAHRPRDARKGIHRVRQPVRRGDDRPARIFFRLSRHDGLRPIADARNRFSIPAVLSQGRDDRAD
jgi:thiamine pyrophosphate-dependent acetolactate synthase large subunit-like protein